MKTNPLYKCHFKIILASLRKQNVIGNLNNSRWMIFLFYGNLVGLILIILLGDVIRNLQRTCKLHIISRLLQISKIVILKGYFVQ